MRNNRNLMVNFKPGENMRKMNLQSVTKAARKKNKSVPNKSRNLYDLLVTSPDALPLSYKRLMGAPATTFLPLRMTTTTISQHKKDHKFALQNGVGVTQICSKDSTSFSKDAMDHLSSSPVVFCL